MSLKQWLSAKSRMMNNKRQSAFLLTVPCGSPGYLFTELIQIYSAVRVSMDRIQGRWQFQGRFNTAYAT